MYYYPNVVGGTENSIKLLAEGLVREGHKVVIYTLDGDNTTSSNTVDNINNVLVYRGYSKSAYGRWMHNKRTFFSVLVNRFHFFCNKNAILDIEKIVFNERIDVIHTNNLGSISLSVWKWAWKNKIPLIHTVRDYWLIDPSTAIEGSNLFLSNFHRLLCKQFANKYVENVTAPSRKTLELFLRHKFFSDANLECIVNCIEFDESILSQMIFEKSARADDNIHFLFVGNLLENKGIRILLDSFKKVHDKDISLVICGSGPEENMVKQEVKIDKKINYKGRCNVEQLKAEYIAADVLIVPSKWDEPFGRIIIEGAQYGLPVIGSNRGGIPEIISTLECGRLFDPNSVQDLTNQIEYFTSRAIIRQYMNNIPKNISYYSVEKQIGDFIHLYKEARDKFG